MAGTHENDDEGARWSGDARSAKTEASNTENDLAVLPRLLTAPELAAQLGLTLTRTYAMARKGLMPAVWLGRQLRFEPNAIREWLATGGTPLPRPVPRKTKERLTAKPRR